MNRSIRARYVLACLVTALVAAACGSSGASSPSTSTSQGSSSSTSSSPGGTTTPAPSNTVWLCRPGASINPCVGNLNLTVVEPNGSKSRAASAVNPTPAIDCFYVYPTVSTETTINSDLVVQPEETATAETQAERFSQVCRVWAPMYNQETTAGLATEGLTDNKYEQVAYDSVLAAWRDYLAHYNDGRPIVFIGHSQGAAMLIDLLRSQVDPNPAVRKLLVSAIILGGNVQVPTGKLDGGTFQHIPACQAASETGCVMAYSSFSSEPPADSYFGRPGQGVSLQSGQTTKTGEQVLCVNPAALSGGSGPLAPIFPAPKREAAPWVEYPDLYTARCESAGGATWLNINTIVTAGGTRPRVTASLGPKWGLHLYDVSLALGNLVQIVQEEVSSLHLSR
jgi:hypothetical protein